MLDKQAFSKFLSTKLKSEKSIKEYLQFLDKGQAFFDETGVQKPTDFSAECIAAYHKKYGISGNWVNVEKFHKCMQYYAESIEKGFHGGNACNAHISSEIRKYYYKDPEEERAKHKQSTQEFVERAKRLILPLPNNLQIAREYMDELSNDEFVNAFRDLRHHIIAMYDDISASPFEWGYPDYPTTDAYRNRVNDVLFSFANFGTHLNGVLTVDAKAFFASTEIKRHKKVELMLKGFKQFGFGFNGYDKKAAQFTVTHIDSPKMITVLFTYIMSLKSNCCTHLDNPKNGYSYRFIEDMAAQQYETAFHAIMDYETPPLMEIQKWLHAEAAKYGYVIDPEEMMEKGMLLYKKGSKRFILVGYGYEQGKDKIVSKIIFRNVFKTHKEQVERLAAIFPETFNGKFARSCDSPKCAMCNYSIAYELHGTKHHACSYHSFWFKGVTLENIGGLLELFKAEFGIGG
jgi:hypothetical protein